MLTLFDLIIFGILLILGNLAIMVLGLNYVMSEDYMRKNYGEFNEFYEVYRLC